MKFGKRLKQQIQETQPEWRDKFLSYKDLKKLVRLISSAGTPGAGECCCGGTKAESESEFVCLLNAEVEKFNAFFMEQEEDFIIRHKELQQRIIKVRDGWGANGSDPSEQMESLRKEIVNFHGEMVLLMNYSNINYTGLAKILKKYDKRTGGLLRLAFIHKIVQQPFFTTDLVSKLVKECESTIEAMFPAAAAAVEGVSMVPTGREGIFRHSVAALLTMQEMRRGSSTYSRFSLPPLNLPDGDLIRSIHFNSPIPTL